MPKFSLLIAVLLSLFFLSACGREPELNYGMGEVEVVSDPNLFPSVVLVVQPGSSGICSGTFISPKAVLTAAHCTQRRGRYRVVSSFGTFSTYDYESIGFAGIDDTSDMAVLILSTPKAMRKKGQVSPIAYNAQAGEKVRLVGFGCDDLDLKKGAGIKRTGLNIIADVSDFIELESPYIPYNNDSRNINSRSILGPYDRAATCFGDSGGPLFRTSNNELSIVGICHAGGHNSEKVYSQFINVNRLENIRFLQTIDSQYDLGIFDVCHPDDPMPPPTCGSRAASVQIVNFIKMVTGWVKSIWTAFLSWIGF